MIKAVFDKKAFMLTVSGHAGGEEGHDLVCCAVSTLVDTMALNLMIQQDAGTVEDTTIEHKDDGSVIGCIPKKGYEVGVEIIFIILCVGIEHLAKQYPEKISYEIV